MTGTDRMNFEMGINAVADCLPKVQVQFKDGEPPEGSTLYVDINLGTLGKPPYGEAVPGADFPDGADHGTIDQATITIDPESLGHANFMKNLGAHEFGHALGLDEDPRRDGERVNVMDPDFNVNTPFIGLSQRDKMMLMEHYMVVPELAVMVLLGSVLMTSRRRRVRSSPG